jgi:hypothetical protein
VRLRRELRVRMPERRALSVRTACGLTNGLIVNRTRRSWKPSAMIGVRRDVERDPRRTTRTDTRDMLNAAHGDPSPELTGAIDALRDCEETCTSCAMAMVDTGGMAAEVRRALDCADLCDAAERVLARGPHSDPRVIAAAVEAAAVACEASAAACGPHAEHHAHCRLHSASAQACADALRALQQKASGG